MAQLSTAAAPEPFNLESAAAAARLSSLRQALRVADMMAGKNSGAVSARVEVSPVWPEFTAAERRCFAARTERLSSAAEAGLSVLMADEVHPAAAHRLSEEIRVGLAHVEAMFAGR